MKIDIGHIVMAVGILLIMSAIALIVGHTNLDQVIDILKGGVAVGIFTIALGTIFK